MNRRKHPRNVGCYKRYSIHIMGIPEKERQEGPKEILETIMAKTFPKLVSGTKPQTQEAQRTPSVPKRLYIGIFLSNYRESKIKGNPERSQRGWGGECLTNRVTEIRITSNFSFRNHASKKRKL